MKYNRESHLPYPQPWEWIKDNITFRNSNNFFVDVGANDGLSSSNSAYFELDLNWNGICIEPHPIAYQKLISNRNCKCYNYCISDTEGEVDFLVITGYAEMLSGILNNYDSKHLERVDNELRSHGGTKTIQKIKSIRLSSILKKHGVDYIDYLSVDVEGGEFDVLRSIDFNAVYIKVISIECIGYNNAAEDLLYSKGYKFLTHCCSDKIFILEK